ncbi:MAG: hypothetical protein R6V85_07750 [Polyangia bacterium]
MHELSITVRAPEAPARSYRFGEGPIRIGRSPRCQLSICHFAVPRELCRAWLESDSGKVRVEERPELTNPLLHRGRPVRGGVGGERLELSVGPVEIEIEPAGALAGTKSGSGRVRLKLLGGCALLAAALAGATLAGNRAGNDRNGPALLEELPASPIPTVSRPACDEAEECKTRSDLLLSRAEELLGRGGPAGRIEAAVLLRRASALLSQVERDRATGIEARADDLARGVEAAYRRAALQLERALAANEKKNAAAAAAVLAGYLQARGDAELARRLERIASGEQNEE